ncbi:RING finger protein 213 [Myotis brandtii]|uniref:RING finger protein 213 n=1 Tax=Myotis brandtii TaxID=109478 RepID=S7PAC2_MYOBR|nr:RING finger protein 213 [Myotis brandtii]
MAHILVQSHTHGLEEVCGAVPFSWRIRDYVEELWLQAQYISKATGPEPVGKLVEIFPQTPLGRFLARLRVEERQELLRSYLRDFLLLTMQVSTWPELEVSADTGPRPGCGHGAAGRACSRHTVGAT